MPALRAPNTYICFSYFDLLNRYQVLDVRRIYVGRANKVMRGKRKPLDSADTAATDSEPAEYVSRLP
jgi:hypothetical protein